MWKKLTLLALTLVLVTAMVATVANADSIAGSGWLEAEGRGRACMTGNSDIVTISGNGVLWYFDGGDVDTPTITGAGVRQEFASGWVRWKGFDGEFALGNADEIIVCLSGESIHLRTEGAGAVLLNGHGRYETGGENAPVTSGRWTQVGLRIDFGQ